MLAGPIERQVMLLSQAGSTWKLGLAVSSVGAGVGCGAAAGAG
jgi:hypothetical protein